VSSIILVGAGNMGGALARGLVAKNLGRQLVIVDPALKPKDARHYRAAGVTLAKTPVEIKKPRAIIFAVKPQMMPSVAQLYATLASGPTLVISIAAGTTTQKLSDWLTDSAIVRAMPNTPASIGKGITALFATPQVTASQRALAERLMRAVGDVIWLDREDLIDSVTAVSGSGPAYVFLLVEAMAKAGVSVGLPPGPFGSTAGAPGTNCSTISPSVSPSVISTETPSLIPSVTGRCSVLPSGRTK